MRWDNLYVAGLGAYLPERIESADEAVADGRYTTAAMAINGYRGVRVAGAEQTGPLMAVQAGEQALARSGLDPRQIGLLLHSYIAHQGLDFWTPASFIHDRVLGPTSNGPAFEIRQGCNGGLISLEVAASFLAARPDVSAVLTTGGDTFHLPYINRWTSDDVTVYGDGAGAVVLSNRAGFIRVRSVVSQGDSTMEPMERGMSGFTDMPFPGGRPICSADRKREYLMSDDDAYEKVIESCSNRAADTLDTALREAGVKQGDLKFFLHQTIAETLASFVIYDQLGVDLSTTTYHWGLGQGMVGTQDVFLSLNHLIETGVAKPGDLVALMGVGAGSVWSVAILEFLEVPTY